MLCFVSAFAVAKSRTTSTLPARHCPSLLPRLCRVAERAFLGTALPRSKTNVFFALDRSVHRLVRVALARYVCKCFSLRSPSPLPARELGLIVAETLEKAFLMRRFSSPRLPRSETIVSFALDRSVHRLVRVALARYVCKCFSLRSPFPLR